MKKINVKLVKYDMTKTKKRNRKDMLVDNRSEKAVITQLERIHKGEKVVAIHEIVWDEEQIKKVVIQNEIEQDQILQGEVKFFDEKKGFGFIAPDDENIEDLFFHKTTFTGEAPQEYDRVEFKLSEAPGGPCAIQVKIIDAEYDED